VSWDDGIFELKGIERNGGSLREEITDFGGMERISMD
jgi:hypothetical protein